MAYVPLNVNVYAAAFSGAMAGLGVPNGAFIVDPLTADYSTVASVAAAFSQAVDTAWGVGAANNYDLSAISNAASNLFTRGPGYPLTGVVLTQANWTVVAIALVAMVRQGDTNASVPQNITMPGTNNNRAYGAGGPAAPGVGTPIVVAAVKLIAKSSGLFSGWMSLSFDALVATDIPAVTIKVYTDTVPGVPLTLGNVAAVGFGSNGVAQPGNVPVNNNGPLVSNAAAGITIAGATLLYPDWVGTFLVGTAATGGLFNWTNIVGRVAPAPGAETPIPIGQTCLVTVTVQNDAAGNPARATGNVLLGMVEL